MNEAPLFLNTCYSLLAPEYGISINAAYLADGQGIVSLLGSGGKSPLDAPDNLRRDEAKYAEGWYASMTCLYDVSTRYNTLIYHGGMSVRCDK